VGTEKTATWGLNLKSNAGEVTGEATAQLQGLKAKAESAQEALKGLQASLRLLKGSSDDVAKAKEELKARIDAEKGALSQANLALLKHGVTYNALATAQKKGEGETKKFVERLKGVGGPVGEVTSRLESLKGLVEGSGGKWVALAAAVAVATTGFVLLGAGIVDVSWKIGKFIATSADALRNMGLMREAASGSAENAKNLGTQVDAMAGKLSTSKEKLNETAVAITRALSGGLSKASGQTIVDTFAAVTEAADAAGDSVGETLKGIVDRGKLTGRLFLSPQDLQGTGLTFKGVAESLAKNMHVGVAQARAALFEGRVSLGAGAAALRAAVEERFGKINAAKLLSLDVQLAKLKERLVGLAKNVALEPMLRALSKLGDLFDENTVSGRALQELVTTIGNEIGPAFEKGVPIARRTFLEIEDGALRLAIAFYKTRNSIRDALKGDYPELQKLGTRVSSLIPSVKGLTNVMIEGVAWFGKTATVAGELAAALERIADVQDRFKAKFFGIGKAVPDGVAAGVTAGKDGAVAAIKGMSDEMQEAFANANQIQSPSKVYEKMGKEIPAGEAQGIDKGAPRAQQALDDMSNRRPSEAPGRSASNLAAGAGAQIMVGQISINVTVPAGTEKAEGIAKAIAAPGVMRALTRALREALITQGIPTQAPVTP
jgi:hypothetical protein